MRRALFIHTLVAGALLAGATPAGAAWQNGAEPVSVSIERQEFANSGTQEAVVSGDGRYVVFRTNATNLFALADPDPPGYRRLGGMFRKDLATGALEVVANGTLSPLAGGPAQGGAIESSVNVDGRFVVFKSAQQLVPQDSNQEYDVYVRDMDVPMADAGAFELISAKDGGDTPATYGDPLSIAGSELSPGTSISGDGNIVLFGTQDASDLPDRPVADLPDSQLFVRNRSAKTTALVNRTTDGLPAGGATTAALSADGSTVIWAAKNARAQTRFLQGEQQSDTNEYWLWRRVADGPNASTRRVTGEADVDDPDCPADTVFHPDPVALGPCYGPLGEVEGSNFSPLAGKTPAISADGRRVAFLTRAHPRPIQTGDNFDLFVADMREGLSRKQANVEITRDAVGQDDATSAPVERIALSANGRWLALSTVRTTFLLSSPVLISPPVASVGQREVYVVDLERAEIERAVRATNGDEVNRGAGDASPSLSADGSVLAFTSDASNLFPGDGAFTDAFVTKRLTDGGVVGPPQDSVSALDSLSSGTTNVKESLSLRVARLPGGRLRLRVRVPSAGILNARVTASVRDRRRRSKRARTRTLARAVSRAGGAGTETVVLRLSQRSLARVSGGSRRRAKVRLLVAFTPADRGEALRIDRMMSLGR